MTLISYSVPVVIHASISAPSSLSLHPSLSLSPLALCFLNYLHHNHMLAVSAAGDLFLSFPWAVSYCPNGCLWVSPLSSLLSVYF